MFFPRTERLDLTPERIHGLRISLNAPVIGLAGIPTGPARASILVHDEADGRHQVTIGIRSLRSGDVVVFSFEGGFGDELPLEVGIDAALSFAESMGFLFDDDEVQGRGQGSRERARGLWVELMGALPTASDGPAAELFDHADLLDLRPDDSFQLDDRRQGSPSPGQAAPGAPPRAVDPELELAISPDPGAEGPFEGPGISGAEKEADPVPAGAETSMEDEELELELDLEDSELGAAPWIVAPAPEPVIDLATEAVELGPAQARMHAGRALPMQESPPSEREPALADSFDLDDALQGLKADQPAPAPGTGLLTKFRFAPGDDGTPAGQGGGPGTEFCDDGDASAASAAAQEAEAQAALSRTALGRVRLVKRRAAPSDVSIRLNPIARLLTSF